jgi:uncharacterized metal-binding protein YceD (DUF177 family)
MTAGSQFIIDVTTLNKDSYSLDTILDTQWLSDILSKCEYPVSPLSGHCSLDAKPDGSDVIIQGNINTGVKTECAVCLSPLNLKLNISFNYRFKPETGNLTNRDEFTPEDLDTEFFTGDKINIGDLLGDEILLELPITPRCTDSCTKLKYLVTADEQQKQKQPNVSGLQALADPELRRRITSGSSKEKNI